MDKELYIKNKIENVLGKNNNFTVNDAVKYFIKAYGAKEILPQHFTNYRTKYYLTDIEDIYWKEKGWLTEDVSRGVSEIEFDHKNEYARALLLDESCLRRAIKNYDELIAKQDNSQLRRKNGDDSIGYVEWRENAVVFISTVDGERILKYEYEGIGSNLEYELMYIAQHTIGGPEWLEYGFDSYRFEEEAEM